MKKNLILRLMLMTAFVLSFHSCRTDLEAITEHKTEPGDHIHQKISTVTFQKETFLSGVNEFKRSANSLSGKSGSNSDYLKRFFIDETSIYKMDVNNIQTYALRAYNIFESPEVVYNLVYRKNGNDAAFSIVEIIDNELIPVYDSQKGIVTKIDNPSTARICTDFYSVEIWNCKENVSWDQCDKCAQCLFTSSGYTSYECGGGGGGNTGGGGSFPGGGDTGGGGGGTGLYDPGGYTFDPNIPPSIEPSYVRAARANSFFYSLTDQAKSWAVEHSDIYCSILEYYLDHIPPSSPPPNSYYWDFANFAIQLFMENPALTWEQFYNQFINTPCQKTKNLVNKPEIKNKLNSLKAHSNTNTKDEDGFQELKSGTLVQGNVNGNNLLEFGIGQNSLGTVHSHQPGTIGILAPQDIMTFLHIVRVQDTNALGNAYSGTVSSNGTYFINFTGTASDLPPAMTDAQEAAYVADLVKTYKEWEDLLSEDSRYSTNYLKVNKPQGLEILFFKLLKKMNLNDKIQLIKEENGNTSSIKENTNGTTTPNPC